MKPVAYYLPHPHEIIYEGSRGLISKVTNHPNPDIIGDVVSTSPVVRIGISGEFETENTIYRPDRRRKAR